MDDPGQIPPPPVAERSAHTWPWSARQPGRPGAWSQRRKITMGIVAAALTVGGGVAIADTASPSPSLSTTAGDSASVKPEPGNGVKMRAREMGLMKLGVGGGMLHGEFTVRDGEDGYRTVLTQNGTIESVRDGNVLTVKSADGWSKDYTLDTSTMIGGERFWSSDAGGGLTQGQHVTVLATVKDGSAHADHVRTQLDQAELDKRGMGRKFDMGEMKGRMLERGAPGDLVRKFRNGPDGGLPVPAPGMGRDMTIQPAPEESIPSE